jgi:hypothetical protein
MAHSRWIYVSLQGCGVHNGEVKINCTLPEHSVALGDCRKASIFPLNMIPFEVL